MVASDGRAKGIPGAALSGMMLTLAFIPVISFALKNPDTYTVYDVSSRLRLAGWQVPAYPLPADAQDKHILRIVARVGMSLDMADTLVSDLQDAVNYLEKNGGTGEQHGGFSH